MAGDFPEDDDIQLSMINDDGNIQMEGVRKRKLDVTDSREEPKRQRVDEFTSSLEHKLKLLDQDEKLQIFKYVEDAKSDVVVKEYIDKLLELDFIPTVPSSEELKKIGEKKLLTTLNEQCSVEVVSLLMDFFQSMYFRNNIGGAIGAQKSVINVKANLHMPNFKKLPDRCLQSMTEIKQNCAVLIQSQAYIGTEFIEELLLIQCANAILKDVKDKVSTQALKVEICNQLDVHCLKATTEFLAHFKIREIDWVNFENKVRHTCPVWRKNNQPLPPSRNYYAKDITQRILSKQESFNPATVQQQYEDFMQRGIFAAKNISMKRNSNASSNSDNPLAHNLNNFHSTRGNFQNNRGRKTIGIARRQKQHHENHNNPENSRFRHQHNSRRGSHHQNHNQGSHNSPQNNFSAQSTTAPSSTRASPPTNSSSTTNGQINSSSSSTSNPLSFILNRQK